MTPKQRVQTALAHQQPDRVPLEMCFTPEFAQRLRTHLFGGAGARHNPHGGGNDYALELAPTHHVQLDTPVENLLALVATAKNPDHGA